MDITNTQTSAQLILKLYSLRREQKLREARAWFATQQFTTMEVVTAINKGPDSPKFRMVLGYWDMAASLVNNGAIDMKMFNDANREHIFIFAKIQHLLPEIRQRDPENMYQLEKLIMATSESQKRLTDVKKYLGI